MYSDVVSVAQNDIVTDVNFYVVSVAHDDIFSDVNFDAVR